MTRLATDAAPRAEGAGRLKTDTLAQSVVLLLVFTVFQRGIGFVRGVLLCRWLQPEELGRWDLAFGFLMMAAPLAVMGLPGSFGRYLEYYRHRRQVRTFLRRTGACIALLALGAVGLVGLGRSFFSKLIFGTAGHETLVALVAVALAALIAFNYLYEVFGGLRMFRLVSILQFVHSLAFAVLSVALVLAWRADASAVVAAYLAASLLCVAAAWPWLRGTWRDLPAEGEPPGGRQLWGRLLPFAASVWITNWLANMMEITDRYMIVHFSTQSAEAALADVGNYHAARLLPLPMIAVAAMLKSAVLPHVSHDWEQGRREEVSARMVLAVKLVALAVLAASTVILAVAPLVFQYAFDGKYPRGLDVLPCTLAYMCWAAVLTLAGNYLWCSERAGLGSLALGVGLAVNVVLNLLLVPVLGLSGAVWATTAANGLVLAATYAFSRRHGMRLDRGAWLLSAAPAALVLGLPTAAALLAVLAYQAATRDWLFTAAEKQRLEAVWAPYAARVRRVLGR